MVLPDTQLRVMVDFLLDHEEMAKGHITLLGPQGKEKYQELWENLLEEVNDAGPIRVVSVEKLKRIWDDTRRDAKANVKDFDKDLSRTGNRRISVILESINDDICRLFNDFDLPQFEHQYSGFSHPVALHVHNEEKNCKSGRLTQSEKMKIINFIASNQQYLNGVLLFSKELSEKKEWIDFCKSIQRKCDETARGDLHFHYLKANGNSLSRLPDSICTIEMLTRIEVQSNLLEYLPEGIGQLSNLEYLDVSDNCLEHLPLSFGNLMKLDFLNLKNNHSLIDELQELSQGCKSRKDFNRCAEEVVAYYKQKLQLKVKAENVQCPQDNDDLTRRSDQSLAMLSKILDELVAIKQENRDFREALIRILTNIFGVLSDKGDTAGAVAHTSNGSVQIVNEVPIESTISYFLN
ncbi:hypothetical protein QAD02_012215 [Eretmocerus hayati]|uniref:Uncharacterized protein n=1 Tax=Eretmocerus hayati TaxID=131215 RepID=A0ACC2NZY1_9HYME|nr:hypothetical protein QAD02_012215 [Eretmocerus hayati]